MKLPSCPAFISLAIGMLLCGISTSRPADQDPAGASGPPVKRKLPPVYVVPNFHPASCGWLANWSVERNYCANSYLNHLDRVRDDASYGFALSECNNMIAIRNFAPARFEELKQRVKEGRVELVNAFFLEPTVNLSGGEALAKMGIEGLRWQEAVMGARPRYCWAIDTCGMHAQMPQICSLLGLDALVYCRCSRGAQPAYWSESPDGTRILTVVPPGYSNPVAGSYSAKSPPNEAELGKVAATLASYASKTASGEPLLILGGSGDYSLAPARKENPAEFLAAWKKYRPDCPLQYGTLSPYVDALRAWMKSSGAKLPAVNTGTGYTFDSFWIENPLVKQWYRRDEHALQSAEMLATISSIESGYSYPVQALYHAWLQMLLNMDRNTLWGSAGGMVFESGTSWDVKDRFEWVEKQSNKTVENAARELGGQGGQIVLFNPANWRRTDPQRLRLPEGTSLGGGKCQLEPDGVTLCIPEVPAAGLESAELTRTPAAAPKAIDLPEVIETRFYTVRIDPGTGALVSLKAKPSGEEMLGGPANVIVAEKHTGKGDPGDFTDARPKRPRIGSSSDFKTTIRATQGPVATTVEEEGGFVGGSSLRRVVRFYNDSPRIEFETELNDVPDLTVALAEFPLAKSPAEVRRGIPFGFSRDDGTISGITPAVRWSDYATPGHGGLALLDRGLPGRELDGAIPVIYLLNTTRKYYGYPNAWLDGKGLHRFEYALVAHDADWQQANIPRVAWEYNCPIVTATGCAAIKTKSFLQTSDNVIVEAMRRDGADIELRLVESRGSAGEASVKLNLPHGDVFLTDLTGNRAQKLEGAEFPVRPQQIVTLRFRTAHPVADIEPLTDWTELVPASKQAALGAYLPNAVGHPPRGK